MPKVAFVTGATGFVGLNLVEVLLARGWRVLALHRPQSDLRHLQRLPAERVVGDVTDAASLRRALPPDVDAVFHVAGDTSQWSGANARQDRVNIDGTRNMVGAALERRARRLVHTSSISAWGQRRGRIDERDAQLGGSSPVNYQRSKFLAEQAVRAGIERGLDAVILNPASILGPYDTHSWARVFLLVAEGRLPGVPPGRASFCHVREVALAHLAAAERGRAGENYLLGGTDASYQELVREIGAALGKPVPARVTPGWALHAAARLGAAWGRLTGRPPMLTPEAAAMVTRELTCDCTKGVQALGFRVVPLRDMVADSARWLGAEGLLPGVESALPVA
ncbi:MAG: SDR family oxidoreductase [Burkholderiales bacterium]